MNDLISLSIPSTPAHLRAARRFIEECEAIAADSESDFEKALIQAAKVPPATMELNVEAFTGSQPATLDDLPPGLVEQVHALDEDDNEGEDNLEVVAAPPPAPAPAPQKILKLLPKAGDLTVQQFYDAEWTDEMLVSEGYAEWETIAPAPAPKPVTPPPPKTAAPLPAGAGTAMNAQTEPTPTSGTGSRPYGEKVDKQDMPWDKRIHASTQTTIADGTFKLLRGVSPELVNQVRSEHHAAGYGRTASAQTPAQTSATATPGAPAPQAPHVLLMRKLSAHIQSLGPKGSEFNAVILKAIKDHGLGAVSDLAKPVNAHLVPLIEAALFPN